MSSRTENGTSGWATVITHNPRDAKPYNVAFGYIDADGFNCVKPSRNYKSEAGASRAARQWRNRR